MSISDLSAWAGVATAAGTLSLALATYRLARGAKEEVEAANAQAKASSEQSAASLQQAQESARQAVAAERALTAQTAPLLSDVPYGIPIVSGYRRKSGGPQGGMLVVAMGDTEPAYQDASTISARIHTGARGEEDARLRVPFRNVGNGVAVVQSVGVQFSDGARVHALSSTPILPPEAVARAELRLFPDAEGYTSLASAIQDRSRLQVFVAYADSSGQPVGALRLDVAPSKSPPDSKRWLVQQVHWAGTLEDVLTSPRLSSAAVTD